MTYAELVALKEVVWVIKAPALGVVLSANLKEVLADVSESATIGNLERARVAVNAIFAGCDLIRFRLIQS